MSIPFDSGVMRGDAGFWTLDVVEENGSQDNNIAGPAHLMSWVLLDELEIRSYAAS